MKHESKSTKSFLEDQFCFDHKKNVQFTSSTVVFTKNINARVSTEQTEETKKIKENQQIQERFMNDYMKTKKALAGLLGLFGSLAAFADFRPPFGVGFLFTESLSTNPKIKSNNMKLKSLSTSEILEHAIWRSERKT